MENTLIIEFISLLLRERQIQIKNLFEFFVSNHLKGSNDKRQQDKFFVYGSIYVEINKWICIFIL